MKKLPTITALAVRTALQPRRRHSRHRQRRASTKAVLAGAASTRVASTEAALTETKFTATALSEAFLTESTVELLSTVIRKLVSTVFSLAAGALY